MTPILTSHSPTDGIRTIPTSLQKPAMMPTALTLAGFDRVLAFRPRFGPEVPRDKAVHEVRQDMVVLHPAFDPDLDAFVRACYDEGLIDHFDWPTWMSGPGQQFTTQDGLAHASLHDCRRILTVIIREERFCEGSFISHAEDGFLAALLNRFADHRRDLDSGDGLPYGVLDRAHGCLLGLLTGDALGAQVEFRSAASIAREFPEGVRTMTGGGPFNLLPGQITDDGEMALCLARSIRQAGTYDPRAALAAYVGWFDSRPFDIGRTTARALQPASAALAKGRDPLASVSACADPDSQANGALMRVAPIGVLGWNQPLDQIATWARQDATLTHPHRICQDANALFAVTVATCLRSAGDAHWVRDQVGAWLDHVDLDPSVIRAFTSSDLPARPDGDKAGWVLIALGNAFHQLFGHKSYEDGLIDTIRLGGDTDTNAAIAGALLGAQHGRQGIPDAWQRPVAECRPEVGVLGVVHPRPQQLWARDAEEVAQSLAGTGTRAADVTDPPHDAHLA